MFPYFGIFYFIYRKINIHYLHLPFLFCQSLEILRLRNKLFWKNTYFVFILFVILGTFSNYERFVAEEFNANDRYGYTNINNEIDAVKLVDNIVKEINNIYKNNKNLNKNLVY